MALLDSVEWDNEQSETIVFVHSPIVKCNSHGQFYTSYAVSLKTRNSCFTRPYSCVQRRYSEFIHLRNLLQEHHPTIEPPELPPRKYFYRFHQSFINERTEGLQNFIKKVVEMPVYLSNKAVHLFLQSQTSMIEIDQLVSGDVPAPRLIPVFLPSSYESKLGTVIHFAEAENQTTDCNNCSVTEVDNPIHDVEIAEEATSLLEESVILPKQPKSLSEPIPILQAYLRPLVSEGDSSYSPRLSPATSSTDSATSISRHVSFHDKVKVAVVRDHLWNFGTRPIRNCAC